MSKKKLKINSGLFKDLNIQQKKAVIHKGSPLLVLAGAGSGKTKVLTCRAAHLVLEKKADPFSILLVTFTNKAANEMKERIKELLNHQPSMPTSKSSIHDQSIGTINHQLPYTGTFHSFCARALRIDGKYLGIPSSYLIYDKTDQLSLIKKVIKKLDISSQRFKPASALAAISSSKNELIGPNEYSKYARGYFQETVSNIYSLYQNLLNQYKALDFNDLILKTVELFEKETSILEKYQNRFHYILVDEYHDTNKAQYQLTKFLAKNGENLTVVADCSQSIYGWRGANFRNVLNLKNDFPKIKTINLEQNYRSKQIILDAAHAVISNNTTHPILKLWTENDKGKKIKLYEAESEKDEANFVVNKIHQPRYSDFVVLYRTNAQSRILEETFLRAGIPYILVGGTRFYERKEIKDCLAYLRIIANPKDMISLERIEKIGKKRMKKFFNWTKKTKVKKLNTSQTLNKILEIVDYWKFFNKKNEKDLERIENIKELFSVCSEFPDLTEFLENVSLVEQEHMPLKHIKTKANQSKNAVTLMTLHTAKGLEFKTVFIIGMEEGLFPHSRSLMEKEKLEEERRLAYVGITRTKENLYLSHSRRRLYFGVHSFNQISRFITEIPENLIEFKKNDYS